MRLNTLACCCAVLAASCQRTVEAPPVRVEVPPPPAPPDPAVLAHRALDGMDTRKPVPLLPMMAQHQKQNMRDHLVAVQEIVLAAASDDFAAIEKATTRIGTSPQMAQMCTHMGAGAPGFTEQALGFHRTADSIAAAAAKKDRKAVLAALGKTLATCTGCHATWKQAVVDEQAFSAAAKTAAPSADEAMRHQHEMMQREMLRQAPH